MVSNPSDLPRFVEFIRGGGLSEASQDIFFVNGLIRGGTERGFFCAFSDIADTTFYLCSNSHDGPGDRATALVSAFAEMIGN